MPLAQVRGQPDDAIGRLFVRLQREEDPVFRRGGSLPFDGAGDSLAIEGYISRWPRRVEFQQG
jgi:hypothetical protein